VLAGLFAVHATRGFVTRVATYTDVGGEHHGTLARADIFGRFRGGERVGFFAGPGITWASRQYNQTFFGVTSEQSARSAFPEFEAGSGINSLRFTVGSSYRFAPRWRLFGGVAASRLSGDAGSSPIIETRNQYRAFASAIYLFR
jgi:outer membrane protein